MQEFQCAHRHSQKGESLYEFENANEQQGI
jgi:hypothetical protein